MLKLGGGGRARVLPGRPTTLFPRMSPSAPHDLHPSTPSPSHAAVEATRRGASVPLAVTLVRMGKWVGTGGGGLAGVLGGKEGLGGTRGEGGAARAWGAVCGRERGKAAGGGRVWGGEGEAVPAGWY